MYQIIQLLKIGGPKQTIERVILQISKLKKQNLF